MTVTQTLSPIDDDEQLPVYERLSVQAWDVKTQDALQQSLLAQSQPFQTWEEYTYQSAPMGRDAHLPPGHDDRPPSVHPVAQPQLPRQQMASSGDLTGSHTPVSPHPSSSTPLSPPRTPVPFSTKPRRPPLPSIPDQAPRAAVPETRHRSPVSPTPSTDSRFTRRDTKPRGARSARRPSSISITSIEITEGKARKEAERYFPQAPAWSSTSEITVEIGPTNVRSSSPATQPLSVNVPESSQMDPTPSESPVTYDMLSPLEEAPPSFWESGQDPVYSLNENFSALSVVSEASAMHSQTPSIPEGEEEADHDEAEEESDPVQILYGSNQRVMESRSAPAHHGNFDSDGVVPRGFNPAVSSSDPRQQYVQTSPTPPPSVVAVPQTPPASQPPPEAAAFNTASLSTFRHEGPRILRPPTHFDPRIAFKSDEPRSVRVSAFYNPAMGAMMGTGAFESAPGRDRSGTSVGSVIGGNPSGLGPMNPPRSTSPPHSVRSAGPGGPGGGGPMQQSPTSMYGDSLGFFGAGRDRRISNPGSFPPNPLYPTPSNVPSPPPPRYPAPPTMDPSGQSRGLVPLAPGYVPGPGQFAGGNYPAMNAGRVSLPNGGGVGGNLVQGQFGQGNKRFSGSTNVNVYGVRTNPW